MKRIFNRKYLAIAVSAILLTPIACKDEFLEIPITGNLTETQLASQAGLDKLLIAVYANLNGRDAWHGGATNWLWGSIRGGDANKGTNSGDFNSMNPVENYAIEPTNSEVGAKWAKSYEGIARANLLLGVIEDTKEADPAVVQRVTAEARFLRGFYYFELKKNFNMVPYIDENTIGGIEAYKVKNDQDIWPMIEADLMHAYENLPLTQSAVGRANKWAAGAFLGKAYLFQKKWQAARDVLDAVRLNGTTSDGKKYALVANFADLFRLAGENSAESVFAFQATGAAQNVNNSSQEYAMNYPYNTLPGNCCGFFQPSFELASSYRVDAAGLPFLDNSFRAANELQSDYAILTGSAWKNDVDYKKNDVVKINDPLNANVEVAYKAVNADIAKGGANPAVNPNWTMIWKEDIVSKVDPRLDVTIGRRAVPFLDWGQHLGFDWIRDQIYAGPYSPKKYTYSKAESTTNDGSGWTPGYTAINFMIMRYADVLLMLAEAEIELGNKDIALGYINQVRNRAANTAAWVKNTDGSYAAAYDIKPYLAFATAADAMKALRFERKLELAMEGHRAYDLVRWGTAETELNAYIGYDDAKITSHFDGAVFNTGKDEYLPIPQRQIDLQGPAILQQNPNY